jgi:cephalosporin hydroxylase
MEISVKNNIVTVSSEGQSQYYDIGSPEAFEVISDLWLRSGWDNKYVYSFSWLGRPIIQLPEDMIRIQEIIWQLKPDVIIETGIAHGGSLIFYASLLQSIGHGRVVGIDIDIRQHNRQEIENHKLYDYITMFEGSSIDSQTIGDVKDNIKSDEKNILVILDSNHSREHVLSELKLYSGLVSVGSYVVVCDGIMKNVAGAPRTEENWSINNPLSAIDDFLSQSNKFEKCEPSFTFNEGSIMKRVTYWPSCYLKRIK